MNDFYFDPEKSTYVKFFEYLSFSESAQAKYKA